jgi:hypothetical protein
MKGKILCCGLFILLLIFSSCQKKQADLSQITFNIRIEMDYENYEKEEAIISKIGIIISDYRSYFLVGRATQEQFDVLRKDGIAIYKKWEWKNSVRDNSEQSNISKKLLFVKDPYLDRWNERNGSGLWFLSRFYQDLNQDGIPELFLPYFGGSSGYKYYIYQITKDGYYDLGTIHFSESKILPTSHNGFNDLIIYRHITSDDGRLLIEEFNGFYYESEKEMYVVYEQAVNEKIFVPDKQVPWEKHLETNKLLWSPKDDDKYRRMIK